MLAIIIIIITVIVINQFYLCKGLSNHIKLSINLSSERISEILTFHLVYDKVSIIPHKPRGGLGVIGSIVAC